MAEPRFWQSAAHPAGLALTPLSWLYGGLERLNRALTQPQHPGKPVICVGNLTAGGGGKTPTVRLVAGWLREAGFAPAVLSRGYGGREKGPLKVDPAVHDAAAVGDEPLMLAAELPVYVCADRGQSLRLAVRDGHDALVKDDGFQNPSMAHHFNLIVVDGATGLGTGRLLPAGPMRQKLAVALKSSTRCWSSAHRRMPALRRSSTPCRPPASRSFPARCTPRRQAAGRCMPIAASPSRRSSAPPWKGKALPSTG